jgi:hypothetical protein
MRRVPFLFALAVLVPALFSCACGTLESDGQADPQHFAETEHSVSGSFLRLYEFLGGASVLGLPLTEARFEDGLWVQYFEKVRFEAAAEMDSARLSKLGELYGQRRPPVRAPVGHEETGHSRYFPQTGHFVRQAFLAFYDACNGQELLGNPIAEFTAENDHFVQYFEYARLEWYPEVGPDEVRLGHLGEACLAEREKAVDGQHLIVSTEDKTRSDKIPLTRETGHKVLASVKYAVTGKGGEQTVDVRVVDAFARGISDVSVEVIVHERSQDRRFLMPPTNAEGYTSYTFPIGASPSCYVILVDVIAEWQGREVKEGISYFSGYKPSN